MSDLQEPSPHRPHFPKTIELRRDGLRLDGELFPWFVDQNGVSIRPYGVTDGTNGKVAWLLSVDIMFFADETTLTIDQSTTEPKES